LLSQPYAKIAAGEALSGDLDLEYAVEAQFGTTLWVVAEAVAIPFVNVGEVAVQLLQLVV
jgi:hypothetical protein